jgi:hypothetical protein
VLSKTAVRLTALFVFAAAFPVSEFCLRAQDSQDAPSVAEAARRAREKKEAASTKPATVITNDSMPAAPAAEATTATNPGSANSAAPDASADTQADSDEDATKKQELDSLKKQIAQKEASVDLAKRELGLEQDNFYRGQDYQRDAAGKQKLDDMQSSLKTQQDELAALKAKLTDAGGDAAKTPAQPNAPTTPEKP